MAPPRTRRAQPKARQERPEQVDWEDVGRWRRISTRIWGDEKFRQLTAPPPSGRYLWFFLVTGPQTTSIPGLCRAREGGLADELGWDLEAFREAFREVSVQGLAEADWKAGVVYLPGGLKYDPPQSPNVILGWRKIVKHEIPDCDLKRRAIGQIIVKIRELTSGREGWEKALLQAFGEAFPEAFGEGLPPPLPKPIHHPPSTIHHPLLPPQPVVVEAITEAVAFYRWAQRSRVGRHGGVSEDEDRLNRVELASWYSVAIGVVAKDRRRLEVAWTRYLADPHFARTGWAWAVFVQVWRTRTPGELPPPPPPCRFPGCDEPADEAGLCPPHQKERDEWARPLRAGKKPADYPDAADPITEWTRELRAEERRLDSEWLAQASADGVGSSPQGDG